jgi:DNA-binding MarR family transcriptional regulator
MSDRAKVAHAETIAGNYLETVRLVEELRYRLHKSIKLEMDTRGFGVDAVQALVLHAIGDRELRHSDIRTRAIYFGTNASYIQKKLISGGFIDHQPSPTDRREVRIKLTPEGHAVAAAVDSHLDRLARQIAPTGLAAGDLRTMNTAMSRMVTMLVHQVAYRL